MDKIYHVFTGASSVNMRDELMEASQALHELSCVPTGMQLYPRDGDERSAMRRQAIANCDYYILVLKKPYLDTGEHLLEMAAEYRFAAQNVRPWPFCIRSCSPPA